MAGRATPPRRPWPPKAAELDRLIERATVDANGDEERKIGLFHVLQDELKVAFEVEILGVAATVERIEITDADEIVAVCRRGPARQRISVLDLPLPQPQPVGAEWIEAYRPLVRWTWAGARSRRRRMRRRGSCPRYLAPISACSHGTSSGVASQRTRCGSDPKRRFMPPWANRGA